MNRLILCILLVFIGTYQLSAQQIQVQGIVTDSKTSKGIAYATISFEQYPSDEVIKTLAADESGNFKVNMPFGSFFVNISAVGYEKRRQLITPAQSVVIDKELFGIDMKEIALNEQAVELAEIIIKPLVETSVDEIIYNLDQDPDREHATLHEILEKVPMVGRTPDNKLFVEMPGVKFLVVRNGKEDALFSSEMDLDQILKAIPAKAFGKVKLMLAPPQRYGGYKYVLSIETDTKNRLWGVVGDEELHIDTNSGAHHVGTGLLGNLEKIRFYIGGGYSGVKAPKQKQFLEQVQLQEDGFTLLQENLNRKSAKNGLGSFTMSYDLGKQHFLSAKMIYSNGKGKINENMSNTRIAENHTEMYHVATRQKSNNVNINYEINYQYDFTGRERVLNLAFNQNYKPVSSTSLADVSGVYNISDLPFSTEYDSKINEQTLQIHYYDPLSSAFRLETGASYVYRNYYTSTDYFSIVEPIKSQGSTLMDRKRHLINAYSVLRYSQKRYSGSVSLRADYINDGEGTRIRDLNGDEEYISETGLDLIPSADFSVLFPGKVVSRLSLGYLMMRNNPNLNMLSSNRNYSNPKLIVTGNPSLRKETLHRFSLGGMVKSLPVTLSYIYSGNAISSYWFKEEDDVIVQSYRNYGKSESFSLSLSPHYYKPPIIIHTMLSASYSKSKTGMENEISEKINLKASVMPGYIFKSKLNVSMGIHYVYTHNTGYSGSKIPPFSVSIGGSQSFFKDRMEVSLSLPNIVNFKKKTHYHVNASDFILNQTVEKRTLPLEIVMRLRVGSFKVKPIRQVRKGAIIDDIKTEE
ncbi:outer membrane beta-barrel protein [Proteiniphilum sp. UBA5384]|uniref:outer membrane beta-barrel protein n=1 Tax=Proteiniphilum sp. UBA5384 TaxID=1947279 RepID=UPI0025F67650|nr:outer membrane beta-barrel protein [Proteiniphilum sp. UBA5384]